MPITLPDPTDDYNTLLTQILSTLSQLQGFYDGLNTEVEELQTSVRGLQGEVSGIQIDLEQVHTDLGNRVEKTTLTYSLYGTDKNGNQAIIPYGTTGLGNSIPQYTADGEIRIPASPTQSYYAANKGYVDKGLQEKLDKTGGEIHGDLLVGGELRVLDDTIIIGNLTVQGTTITEDAETIMSKANVIVTNSEGAPLTQLSGIGIRTNATLVYGIMYDPGDDTVKLGEGTLDANNEFTFNPGEGTAVATRADSAMWTNGHLSMWNAAEYRFVDSGIAANNVVTVNTAQQITGAKTFARAVRVGTGNVYASYYTGGVIWRDSNGNDHANIFPAGSGTLALTSDIPTDYVTEKEFSNLAQQVEDLYALGEQGGLFTVTTVEDTYTARETAGGNLNIADGVSTIVKTIEGSTVKCDNLIPYPYANTTKTVNGVTFTDNGDGTITVNGTATDKATFNLKTITVEIGSNYFLSGCPSTGSTTTYIVYAADGVYGYADAGAGRLINPASTNLSLSVLVYAGATLSNVVFRPMLNAGTTALPYQPYFKGLKNASFEKIVSTGKNLVPYPYEESTKTENGITFTVNSDGSITANGTTTVNPSIFNLAKISLKAGTYALRSFANVENAGVCQFYIDIPSEPNDRTGNGVTFTLQDDIVNKNVNIIVNPNQTVNNLIFKPMLQFGTTAQPFEPYKQSVLSLPAPVELPVYNTLNFQTGKNVSQGVTQIFDGTEDWYISGDGTNIRAYVVKTTLNEGICNFYKLGDAKIQGEFDLADGAYIRFNAYGIATNVDEWKAYIATQYAAGDPLIVRYKTAEVQSETDLNASSDRYLAWKGGSETIVQGEVDNSEYGAENTVKQDYFTITGGTANGN